MPSNPSKECPICCLPVTSFKISPTSCKGGHDKDQRAYEECWEAYLSKEVEEKDVRHIRCMFDDCILDEKNLKRLSRDGTFGRYDEKLNASTKMQCQARCWASKRDPSERNSPSVFQDHDRQQDGRVFACKFCAWKTCIDCDRRQHDGETCEEYRARVIDTAEHRAAEEATAKMYRRCSSCGCFWAWSSKGARCGHTTCAACKFRFCGNCFIPWVGDGSAYLRAKLAHADCCRYRTKDTESRHGLQNRNNAGNEEAMKKVQERKEKAAAKRKEKRDASNMAGEASSAQCEPSAKRQRFV